MPPVAQHMESRRKRDDASRIALLGGSCPEPVMLRRGRHLCVRVKVPAAQHPENVRHRRRRRSVVGLVLRWLMAEQLSDAELADAALSATPSDPFADDAVPFGQDATYGAELLPEWYMPVPQMSAADRTPRRVFTVGPDHRVDAAAQRRRTLRHLRPARDRLVNWPTLAAIARGSRPRSAPAPDAHRGRERSARRLVGSLRPCAFSSPVQPGSSVPTCASGSPGRPR